MRVSGRLRAALVGAAVLVLLGGCASSGGSTARGPNDSKQQDLPWKVSVGGSLSLDREGTVDSLVVISDSRGGKAIGVRNVAPLAHEGGDDVNVAVYIEPYEGDGTFEIPAGQPSEIDLDAGTTSTVAGKGKKYERSTIAVLVKGKDPQSASLQAFVERSEPCTVTIRDRGMAGRVHCPQLATLEQQVVSVDASWGSG